MSRIRTKEDIERMIAERKAINERKKQRERQRAKLRYKETAKRKRQHEQHLLYINEQERKRQTLQDEEQRYKEMRIVVTSRWTDTRYNDYDIYTTREELQEAEERDEGKINWDYFDYLVDDTINKIKEILL